MIRLACAALLFLASSLGAPALALAAGPEKAAPPAPPPQKPATEAAPPIDITADGGIAMMSQSFHSNGASRPGRLADYDFSAEGAGARLTVRGAWMLGSVFRLGFDAGYRFAGLTGVSATTVAPDGSRPTVRLGLQSHQATAAITAGALVNALGGLTIDARLGPALLMNYVDADPRAPLPSDRTGGLFAGLRIAAPALVGPVGVELEGSWLGLGTQDQTPNLEDGTDRSSTSLMGGAALTYSVMPRRLSLLAGYSGLVQTSSYSGPSIRNDPANGNVSSGERVQGVHMASLGLKLLL